MLNLQDIVEIVLYMLVAAVVFGLLFFLIRYLSKEFPSMAPYARFARIVLVVLIVLVVIGFLMSLIGGQPLFRWGGRPAPVIR